MIRRTLARARGRHRDGVVIAFVPRYTWDHEARAEAAMLEITRPGWSVLYGTGSRLFHAIATWPTPEPVLICDRTIDGLKTQMREAETTALVQRRQLPTTGRS
ncbi:hypothetical protein [Streptosporangium sp. NPDC049046]|uniref:hypothetical protein n=1 Tax=Streptosporangium sp. NPDC049046 TaxID=3155031 RepID=UPI00341AB46E